MAIFDSYVSLSEGMEYLISSYIWVIFRTHVGEYSNTMEHLGECYPAFYLAWLRICATHSSYSFTPQHHHVYIYIYICVYVCICLYSHYQQKKQQPSTKNSTPNHQANDEPSRRWSCGDPTEPTPWCIWSPREKIPAGLKEQLIEIYMDWWWKLVTLMEDDGKTVGLLGYHYPMFKQKKTTVCLWA